MHLILFITDKRKVIIIVMYVLHNIFMSVPQRYLGRSKFPQKFLGKTKNKFYF